MLTSSILTFFLLILTVFSLYAYWRFIKLHRSKKGEKTDVDTEDKEKEHKRKQKWGVEKDAYCYPKINDVMGFEFVKVVKVKNASTADKPQNNAEPERRPFSETPAEGKLRTISYGQRRDWTDEDQPYPEEDRYRPMQIAENRPRLRPIKTGETQPDEADITNMEEFDENELLLAQNSFAGQDWPNRDFDSCPSEEEWNMLLNENEDLIEEPDATAEAQKTSENIKIINQETENIINEMLKKDFVDEAYAIMEGIDSDEDADGSKENITIDDLPDIE